MQIATKKSDGISPARTGWTYAGVIILTTFTMMIAMAVDIIVSGKVGIVSNFGMVSAGVLAAVNVRTADYQAAIWIVPLAWVISLVTVGQFAPMRGGSFLREQVLNLTYGLAMNAWWILGATIISAGIAIFRRGRQP